MPLSEDDRIKFERDFKYLVNKYIEFLSLYNKLLTKINLTTEEDREFQMVQQLLLTIGEVLTKTLQSLGEDLFGKSLDLYYHYKNIASTGNNDAKELLHDLKPLLAASLQARINKN